jgi:hypothetical protein
MNADTEQWYQASADLTRATARENYMAGGGSATDFDAHWSRELLNRGEYFDAIRRKEFDRAGGILMYLVSGIKAGERTAC